MPVNIAQFAWLFVTAGEDVPVLVYEEAIPEDGAKCVFAIYYGGLNRFFYYYDGAVNSF